MTNFLFFKEVAVGFLASGTIFASCEELPFSFHRLHKQAHINDAGIQIPSPNSTGWTMFQPGIEYPFATNLTDEEHGGIPPTLTCRPEFELYGDTCRTVLFAKGTPSCTKTADLYENGLCITMESLKPIMKCPEGAFSDGKKCFEVNYLAPLPECPKDKKLTEDGMGCIPKSPNRAESTCPDGFTKIFNKCIREKKSLAIPSCLPDYSLSYGPLGAECFNSHIVIQEMSCKGIGFSIRDGQCVRIETAPTVPKCPTGFKDQGDGFCAMSEMVMADTVCPEGSNRSKKGCVTTHIETVIPSCKKDFSFHNGSCEKTEEKPIDLNCPEGFKLKNGVCSMQQTFDAERVCPPGSLARDKGCFLRREVPSTTFCESGKLDEIGMCVETLFTDTKLHCAEGTLVKGMCEKKYTISADSECPNGAHLDGGKCISFHKVAPDVYCKSTGAKPGPEGCTTAENGDIFVQCPKDWKLYGDQCFKEITTTKMHVCPNGMNLVGKKCEGQKKLNTELTCPKGYTAKSGKCISFEEEPAQMCCPDNYRLTLGQCLPEAMKSKSLRRLTTT